MRKPLLLAFVLTTASACTSNKPEPPRETIPIRSEVQSPETAAPLTDTSTTATTDTTIAAVTTELVVSTTTLLPTVIPPGGQLPPGTPNDYKVPVIVKFVPAGLDESELIPVLTDLLQQYSVDFLQTSTDRATLAKSLAGPLLEETVALNIKDRGAISAPGLEDRYVLTGLVRTSTDVAQAELCLMNGGYTYMPDGASGYKLFGKPGGKNSVDYEYELRRTSQGWRIATAKVVGRYPEQDRCPKP